MKDTIIELLAQAMSKLQQDGVLPADLAPAIQLERTKDEKHGDFATNLALMVAKPAKKAPRELAQLIMDNLPANDNIEKMEIAGPGFINFFVKAASIFGILQTIFAQAENFGRSNIGNGERIQIEFVSANPTGPLHVGHGRGAAYGATLADVLAAAGYNVEREYYVNDAGRQMDILAASVWLRYLELAGEELPFPSNGYQGDYVWDIAATLHREQGDNLRHSWQTIAKGLPLDAPEGDKELYIDAIIDKAKQLLEEPNYQLVFDTALNTILNDIRDDLALFNVTYQHWFSERSLMTSNAVATAVERLTTNGYTYEMNGAIWFKSSEFGDEKDRVLVRENGQSTYFASDVAYHMQKFERGYDRVINIWGADHHGYVPRVKAALTALGENAENLTVLLVQFAVLYKGGEKMQMSTRSGQFVTLRQLRKDVGTDAARFFYVLRRCEQHLDFDIDLAKSKSSENPIYYIQYAHARICNVLQKLAEKNLSQDDNNGLQQLTLLTEAHEQTLAQTMSRYPEVINQAATKCEPHLIAHYLKDLANDVHSYYDTDNKRITILVDEDNLRHARLVLIKAARQVLANGLNLLGVSAPERM